MKRFHVHVSVDDLQQSLRFYAAMFGSEPTVLKPDYAKWMLDDPRVNFAISQRGGASGVNHLGVQAETDEELESIHANLRQADAAVVAEKDAHCCYARSDKYWVTDPQGVAWESFRSLGEIPLYAEDSDAAPASACGAAGSCCAPDSQAASPGEKVAGRTSCGCCVPA